MAEVIGEPATAEDADKVMRLSMDAISHHRVLTDDERTWVAWVIDTCELFGAATSTAHKVASVVAEDFQRGFLEAPTSGRSPE